jgi:WD40 repeat protein
MSIDTTIRVWNLGSGALERNLIGHEAFIMCLDGDEDQDLAVSGGFDWCIRVWQVSSGECLRIISDPLSYFFSLSLLPAKVIVSSTQTGPPGASVGAIKVWDNLGADTHTPRCLLDEEGAPVCGMAWQQGVGPMRLVSSHKDGVRLWDFVTGKCLVFINSAVPRNRFGVWADLHRLVYSQTNQVKVLDLNSRRNETRDETMNNRMRGLREENEKFGDQ